MVSLLDRFGSLSRGLRRKPAAKRNRRLEDRRMRMAIDQLECRRALAITGPLTIGQTMVASFTDAPTGPGNIGDYVTVSIEGTKGTAIFNGGAGVADGGTITRIDIVDASPDFQMTFNGVVRTSGLGTPAAVPYGSDGIIQLGQIFTTNVIRGINTVKGPLTNTAPTTGTLPLAVGFTYSGSGNEIKLAGDWTGSFANGDFVCATPEVVSGGTIGSPVFARLVGIPVFSGGFTTITLNSPLPGNTTGGALTLAETVEPYFELTTFVGVNFSNRNLKESGGLFVDRVVGADTPFEGETVPDLGIMLTKGLLAYSSIGIRDELDALAILGDTADGRMFVEYATGQSSIYVGQRNSSASKNSKFELVGGLGEFGANVYVLQNFNGIMNLGGPATGTFRFLRNVGPLAVLNAQSWEDVEVLGNFAGTINSTTEGPEDLGDVQLDVAGNIAGTARVNSEDELRVAVGGSIEKGAILSADQGTSFVVGGNVLGTIQAGSSAMAGLVRGNVSGATLASSNDISLVVGGSVVNSTLAADDDFSLDVEGSIRGSTLTSGDSEITFNVAGNVVNSTFAGGISGLVGGSVTNSKFFAEGYELAAKYPDITLAVAGNMTNSAVQAVSQVTVAVAGNVAKSRFISTTSDVTVNVGGSLTDSTLIAADDGVTLAVGRDATNVKVVGDDEDMDVAIGRNFTGAVQSGSGDLIVAVGGSVLKGSSFTTGGDGVVEVDGNFDGSVTVKDLRYFVDGNVSKASRIVAQRVTEWGDFGGTPNFGIGGRLDGIVNVVEFDAASGEQTVTLVNGGAGQGARFYVDRFATDNLVFNGNFRGNLRVLQDLVANLTFNGNVDRITVGGRVGSYVRNDGLVDSGNPVQAIDVVIVVTGRLLFMNTNSYFQADVPGVSGTFWNVPTGLTPAATGQIVTGSYGQIVPTRPTTVAPPVGGDTQTYTVPDAPTFVFAAASGNQIVIDFVAPPNNALPILRTVYYQWSTDGTNWSNFTNVLQQPGLVLLPGTFADGNYTIRVRAINAIGPSGSATSNQVTVSTGP